MAAPSNGRASTKGARGQAGACVRAARARSRPFGKAWRGQVGQVGLVRPVARQLAHRPAGSIPLLRAAPCGTEPRLATDGHAYGARAWAGGRVWVRQRRARSQADRGGGGARGSRPALRQAAKETQDVRRTPARPFDVRGSRPINGAARLLALPSAGQSPTHTITNVALIVSKSRKANTNKL